MDWPGAGTRIYLIGSIPTCTVGDKEAKGFKKQSQTVQVWLHPSLLEMEPGGVVEAGIAASCPCCSPLQPANHGATVLLGWIFWL